MVTTGCAERVTDRSHQSECLTRHGRGPPEAVRLPAKDHRADRSDKEGQMIRSRYMAATTLALAMTLAGTALAQGGPGAGGSGGAFAQHRAARVAGNEMRQQKCDEQDAEQYRDGCDETPREKCDHFLSFIWLASLPVYLTS